MKSTKKHDASRQETKGTKFGLASIILVVFFIVMGSVNSLVAQNYNRRPNTRPQNQQMPRQGRGSSGLGLSEPLGEMLGNAVRKHYEKRNNYCPQYPNGAPKILSAPWYIGTCAPRVQ